MTTYENPIDDSKRASLRLPPMVALAHTAMLYRYRYRGLGWRGPLLLCASVLDVLLYAVALSLVLESVFQLQGTDRFVLMLIGLIVLRWSLSCALQAYRVAHFSEICQPHYRRPVFATMILAMGPPSFVFLISVVLLGFAIVLTVHEPFAILHMLGWGLFVALIQLSWNSVLVLVVIQARCRRLLTSEVPIVLGFVLVLILSPIAYQFSDIPDAASRVLTSFNPASHLLAGYQNALWHLREISLEVLPASTLIVGLLFVVTLFLWRNPSLSMEERNDDTSSILVFWGGRGWSVSNAPKTSACEQNYRIWPNELPWILGGDFLHLVGATRAHQEESRSIFLKLSDTQDAEQLLKTPLPLMSGANKSRLCVAAILPSLVFEHATTENVIGLREAPTPLVVLDGLLDHAKASEIQAFKDIVFLGNAKHFAIRTYNDRVAELVLSGVPNKNALIASS